MADLTWKRILCPVDFSEESRAALRVAVDLCRRLGAALTLFHVHDRTPNVASQDLPADRLAEWGREARAAGIGEVATTEADGDPERVIAEEAEREGCDLIVMGTHGREGRDRSLAGSVAESTVRRARCPVLAVHAEWQRSDAR
jgi:nucleotide-binding universal stress UspA family protein